MNSWLQPREVGTFLESLRPHLTTMQATRLAEISRVLDEDGRFLLREALEVAEFAGPDSRAQDAFQDFRQRVNKAAEKAGVDLRLELDSRKTTPDRRHGWFSGGDLVEKGILAFSEDAAGTGIEQPVAPRVAELGKPTTRLYVSYHEEPGRSARQANVLLEKLREWLGTDSDRSWEINDSNSARLGEDTAQVRDRLSAEADLRIALLSPRYLADPDERGRVIDRQDPVVAFALSGLPAGPLDLGRLKPHDVRRRDKPWDELTRTAQRREYVQDMAEAILRALSTPPARTGDRKPEEALWTDWAAKMARSRRGDDSRHLVDAELAEATLHESQLDPSHRAGGPPLRAIDRLVSWATDERPGAPRLCALLGDVGMGKTTTAKLFTHRLLELRKADVSVPLPVLFDLRDVRITGLAESMTLDHILDSMFDVTRPTGVASDRLNAKVLRERLTKGDVVVVFDGLDEVLVHLSPHDRQLFTRQLWRVKSESPTVRMLLSCRTQYFRTIRDEVTYFTGESRQGLRGSDYLALLMLPFRDEQIRDYLAGNLARGSEWVDTFLETIAAVHDLPDLARRPITLRLIADQVEFIETAKLAGRTLRSVDIYAEVVERWIARDAGKHTLIPDHKRLLMEEIAAALWRSGQNAWSPTQVDDWLLELLDRRPDLQRHYRERVPDLWKADFRTATFLKRRQDDTFEFGHRSLFEYFLARYLYRTLREPGNDVDAISMRVPSAETLDFLGQSIAADEKPTAVDFLYRVGRAYSPLASELAFAYALHAEDRGYPRQSLTGVQLNGAKLGNLRIGKRDAGRLRLTEANLVGADLRQTRFFNVDLSGGKLDDADLTNCEFHESLLRNTSWARAEAVGTLVRGCSVDGVDFDRAEAFRAQLINCTPPPQPMPGFRLAPGHDGRRRSEAEELVLLFGHSGPAHVAAWSGDSLRVVTGSHDGARTWDARTGRQLHHLVTRGRVRVVAWSPDNTRILIAVDNNVGVWEADAGRQLHSLHISDRGAVNALAWGPDNTRIVTSSFEGTSIWDADTGRQTLHLTSKQRHAVAWSPDNTRILTGSDDGAEIWDADTGRLLHHCTGPGSVGWAVAWSPDNTRILTGSDDGAEIWDADTGRLLHRLMTEGVRVSSVAWSPDNTRILTGDDDGGAEIWDADTGQHQAVAYVGYTDGLAWASDSTHFLVTGSGAEIWNADTGRELHHLISHTSWIRSVAWSSDSTRILTGSDDNTARIWNADTGQPLHHLIGHTDSIPAVAWSPDNTRILTGSDDTTARIWNADTGQELRCLTGHEGAVHAVAWSPDNTRILTGSDDEACGWDADTGQPLHQLTGSVRAVAWSPGNTRILTGGEDEVVRIWDADTGRPLHHLTGHTDSVQAVAWSPDNTRILTGSEDTTARIWNADTGQELRCLTGHTDSVQAVAWSPDNTRVVTGSEDNTATIWDADTGQPLHHLAGHIDWVRAVAWSPDNTRILTGSDDCTARIWNADTGRPTGPAIALLPGHHYAVFDSETNELIACTEEAWRWLGWSTVIDGRRDYLPAETFGPLPVVP